MHQCLQLINPALIHRGGAVKNAEGVWCQDRFRKHCNTEPSGKALAGFRITKHFDLPGTDSNLQESFSHTCWTTLQIRARRRRKSLLVCCVLEQCDALGSWPSSRVSKCLGACELCLPHTHLLHPNALPSTAENCPGKGGQRYLRQAGFALPRHSLASWLTQGLEIGTLWTLTRGAAERRPRTVRRMESSKPVLAVDCTSIWRGTSLWRPKCSSQYS